jgi:hypothetical protein
MSQHILQSVINGAIEMQNYGCQVHVLAPYRHAALELPPSVKIIMHHGIVSELDGPLAKLPKYTLQRIIAMSGTIQNQKSSNIAIVLCGPRTWRILNQLHVLDSKVLERVSSMVLDVKFPELTELHHLYGAYQHIYQEIGVLGIR